MEKLINQEWLNNIENSSKEFILSLKNKNDYRFSPANKNLTYFGKNLELGFSCFALKIYYILGRVINITIDKSKGNFIFFSTFNFF